MADNKTAERGALQNSALFDVHRWSDYPEVKAATDRLFVELAEGLLAGRQAKKARRHLRVTLLNLYATWLQDPTMYVAYPRAAGAFKAGSRYNALHISFGVVTVIDALFNGGWIENHRGIYARSGEGRSYVARMRAKPALIELMQNRGVRPEHVGTHQEREALILKGERDANGDRAEVEYDDTSETNAMRGQIAAYNELLAGTAITLSPTPIGPSVPDNPRPFVPHWQKRTYRIFHDRSWEAHGRLYGGWWQNIPRDWRTQIVINGKPTTEVDYSALHIILAYADAGIDYWKRYDRDPYTLPGYDGDRQMRQFAKKLLLTALNASSPKATVSAVWSDIRKDREKGKDDWDWLDTRQPNAAEVLRKLEKLHDPILHLLYACGHVDWLHLDSRIAMAVIGDLTNQAIPCLSVHDSFIVQTLQVPALYTAMGRALESLLKEFGVKEHTPGLKFKGQVAELWQLLTPSPMTDAQRLEAEEIGRMAKADELEEMTREAYLDCSIEHSCVA